MRLTLVTSALYLSLLAPFHAQARSTTATTGVSVVPMSRDTVLRDMTIVVRDGRIQALGPARTTPVRSGARRIDRRGRFVIPGLADMHTHLFADGPVPDSAGAAELEVILANGVTVIRLMIGTPEHLALRKEIEAGPVMGPRLWIASPQLTGGETENAMVVRTPEEARAAVSRAAEAGYDFIKLTTDISAEVYDAIIREAAGRRIPVVGHVDPRVGVARALAAGQHIEHLDNYMESVLADSAPSRASVSDLGLFRARNWETLDHVDDRKIAQTAGATARSGTFTSATLSIFKLAFGVGETDQEIQSGPTGSTCRRRGAAAT